MQGRIPSYISKSLSHAEPKPISLTPSISQWLRMWKLALILGTPAAMFAGVMMLFVYLAHIHRLDLLQQVVASSSGLILIVMWAVIASLSLTVMFFGSLCFIDAAASTYDNPMHIPKAMS